ncbi:MAG: hypothetical protein QGH42_04020 [Kiritimatiellia bacterium]|jgi:hypothetical protein|nr:hypothetical protein [Kiritimatiellia bacterium]MDP6810878.1 hypothetical protein [Kiritimatiellia bacterium]MDP7023403.1 hypothetical protein [Kiritimatiellia bacterium]
MKKLLILLLLLPGLTTFAQPRAATATAREKAARIDGAITGGLSWLAERQVRKGEDAGSWPAQNNNYSPAVASLAGLAFLANGHLPGDDGPYGEVVGSALKYVMGSMAPDGYVGQGANNGMYIHAITTLFALSCLGMQADEAVEPELADWCRRSVEVTLRAQKVAKTRMQQGGWRYDPYTSQSDISVTCWQLLVMHSARQAGFEIEMPVFYRALTYLNGAYAPVKSALGAGKTAPKAIDHAFYYPDRSRPGAKPSRSSSALVILVQSLLHAASEQRTAEVLGYLKTFPPSWGGEQYGGYFYFSSFYMAQGMFQIGGEEWDSFGPQLSELLLEHQAGDGSWPYPSDNAEQANLRSTGQAYPVAMAVLMLSLDKQYLPMYQRQSSLYGSGKALVVSDGATPEDEPVAEEKTPPDNLSVPLPVPVPEDEPDETEDWEDEGWGDEDDMQDNRPAIGEPLGGNGN